MLMTTLSEKFRSINSYKNASNPALLSILIRSILKVSHLSSIKMKFLLSVSLLGLAASVNAQAQFGAPENSAAVLAALQQADASTITSGQAAAAFRPKRRITQSKLVIANQNLLSDWLNVTSIASSSPGFFTPEGAQAIIDYINNTLFPDTEAADKIYIGRRDDFVSSGFINFINPGLISLRQAVAGASGAVEAKTPAKELTPIINAFAPIEQNYADTQEFQQFGPGGAQGSPPSY